MGAAPSWFGEKKPELSRATLFGKEGRHTMLIGTRGSGKSTIATQLDLIYEKDIDYRTLLTDLSSEIRKEMVEAVREMVDQNLEVVPALECPTDHDVRAVQALRKILDHADGGRESGDDTEDERSELDHHRVTSAMKTVWTLWPSFRDLLHRHWNRYHTRHEITYFFDRLAEEPWMEGWLSGEQSEIGDDDGIALLMRSTLESTEISEHFYLRGAVSNVVRTPLKWEETRLILDHWARVECGLGQGYWYSDLILLVNRALRGHQSCYQIHFAEQSSVVFHRWLDVPGNSSKSHTWARFIPEIDTFVFVSSLTSAAERRWNGGQFVIENDLRLLGELIDNPNRKRDSQGVLVLSKKDILEELIQRDVPLMGLDSAECDYAAGLDRLSETGMSEQEWLDECVQNTIDRIKEVYLSVKGATEWIRRVIVMDSLDTGEVCEKLLNPRMFAEIIGREGCSQYSWTSP